MPAEVKPRIPTSDHIEANQTSAMAGLQGEECVIKVTEDCTIEVVGMNPLRL